MAAMGKTRKVWTEKDLSKLVELYKIPNMSISALSREFNVGRSTIRERLREVGAWKSSTKIRIG